MNRRGKIIAYSIALGIILIEVILFVVIYFWGYKAEEQNNNEIADREQMIEKTDSCISGDGMLR